MYNKFDLATIAFNLGDHFNTYDRDTYRERCEVCSAWVDQEDNECPDCNTPVVWLNSKMWTALYGSAKMRIQELEAIPASCESGKELVRRCRALGFSNKKEDKDWARFEKQLGQAEAQRVIEYVFKKPNSRGRGAMAHAMAIARKKLRENPLPQKKAGEVVPTMEAWQ